MTITALYAWPDYDENDKWNGASMLGTYQGEAMAVVLKSRHHDAFLRLALAAPELLHALEIARDHLEVSNHEGEEDETLALINSAIAKAKGE